MIKAKKSLGQNFLIDPIILNKIVDLVNIQNKAVLEIGPGTGNLTHHILKKKPKKLIVIEKDNVLAFNLQNKFNEQINIINEDVLEVDEHLLCNERLTVFGNLPYNISTKILAKLLTEANGKNKWNKLLLMFQLEVANRIVAKPDTKQYGRLSLFSQFYSHPSLEFLISKNSFFPVPKVESALVKFENNFQNNAHYNSVLFQDIIRKSFQGRRKMLRNTLKNSYRDISYIMKLCKIPENSRPENITLKQFCELTRVLERSGQ